MMYDEHGNLIVDDETASMSSSSISMVDMKYIKGPKYLNQSRSVLNDSKLLDKGFRRIKRNIRGKKENLEFYTTSITPGAYIRDAVTGATDVYHRVGSSDENLFFKVRVANGGSEYGSDTLTLFFDNPEAYERLFKVTLGVEEKSRWNERYLSEKLARS